MNNKSVKKKSFLECLLERLRELEVMSSALEDITKLLAPVHEEKQFANKKLVEYFDHCWPSKLRKAQKSKRNGAALLIRAKSKEIEEFKLFAIKDFLYRKCEMVKAEITRAVCVNWARQMLRDIVPEYGLSGVVIAKRVEQEIAQCETLYRWMRNIDLARKVKWWETRRGGMKPEKFTREYFERFFKF